MTNLSKRVSEFGFSLRVELTVRLYRRRRDDHDITGYAEESPDARPESIDEQVTRKGIRPVESVEAMAQDGVLESEEELEQFLAHVYAARHADLA